MDFEERKAKARKLYEGLSRAERQWISDWYDTDVYVDNAHFQVEDLSKDPSKWTPEKLREAGEWVYYQMNNLDLNHYEENEAEYKFWKEIISRIDRELEE